MAEREAVFRRYGYDSAASIAFVLSKILPLGGQVLEVGSGKGRFLTALAGHVAQVTSIDIDAEEQRFAILNAVHAGVSSRIRFVLQNAQQLGWRAGVFDVVVTMKRHASLSQSGSCFVGNGSRVEAVRQTGDLRFLRGRVPFDGPNSSGRGQKASPSPAPISSLAGLALRVGFSDADLVRLPPGGVGCSVSIRCGLRGFEWAWLTH